MVALMREADNGYTVSDSLLLALNYNIDNFYKQVR